MRIYQFPSVLLVLLLTILINPTGADDNDHSGYLEPISVSSDMTVQKSEWLKWLLNTPVFALPNAAGDLQSMASWGGNALLLSGTHHTVLFEEVNSSFKTSNPLPLITLSQSARCMAQLSDNILLYAVGEEIRLLNKVLHDDQWQKAVTSEAWVTIEDANWTSISILDNGARIAAADAHGKYVYLFSRDGRTLNKIGGDKEFIVPSPYFSVAWTGQTLAVTDPGRHCIKMYDKDGNYLKQWGKTGTEDGSFSGCCNPAFIVALQDGKIVSSEKGTPRVCVFSPDGTFLGKIYSSPSGSEAPLLAAITNQNFCPDNSIKNLWALGNRLIVFDRPSRTAHQFQITNNYYGKFQHYDPTTTDFKNE